MSIENSLIGAGAALTAGAASFLSPCVLPLVPGYLSIISGVSAEDLSKSPRGSAAVKDALKAAVFFVLGFALLFTALGASASLLGGLLGRHRLLLERIAGIVMAVFGLHLMGLVPIKILYYEKRLFAADRAAGPWGAFVMGLAFAFGWTPCIGPILASILALATTQETALRGAFLLFVYSLGLGMPFLLAAAAMGAFLKFVARFKKLLRYSEIAAGAVLTAVGVLVFSHKLAFLVRFLPRALWKFSL